MARNEIRRPRDPQQRFAFFLLHDAEGYSCSLRNVYEMSDHGRAMLYRSRRLARVTDVPLESEFDKSSTIKQ